MKRTYVFLAVALASGASATTVASAQSDIRRRARAALPLCKYATPASATSSSAARGARFTSSRGITPTRTAARRSADAQQYGRRCGQAAGRRPDRASRLRSCPRPAATRSPMPVTRSTPTAAIAARGRPPTLAPKRSAAPGTRSTPPEARSSSAGAGSSSTGAEEAAPAAGAWVWRPTPTCAAPRIRETAQ